MKILNSEDFSLTVMYIGEKHGWTSYIMISGESYSIGHFDTQLEAFDAGANFIKGVFSRIKEETNE